jgi:hypothetical protein
MSWLGTPPRSKAVVNPQPSVEVIGWPYSPTHWTEKHMSAYRDPRHHQLTDLIGPLTQYESALCTELERGGYAGRSIDATVGKMRRLSRWMGERGVTTSGLTPAIVDEYLAYSGETPPPDVIEVPPLNGVETPPL